MVATGGCKVCNSAMKTPEPLTFRFEGDDETPNNPALPVLLYRDVVPAGERRDAAAWFEGVFARHGWADGWRNGIHPFLHFHTTTHEVLGIAAGRATVQLGGAAGRVFEVVAGISVSTPAPICWSSAPIRATAASTRSGRARSGGRLLVARLRQFRCLAWIPSRVQTPR
jgi:hypothetical protein